MRGCGRMTSSMLLSRTPASTLSLRSNGSLRRLFTESSGITSGSSNEVLRREMFASGCLLCPMGSAPLSLSTAVDVLPLPASGDSCSGVAAVYGPLGNRMMFWRALSASA